jgi:putative transposase
MRQHLALNRHLLRASQYRKHLAARFASRRDITEPARSLSIPT